MTLTSSKTIGGIGALLLIISGIGTFGTAQPYLGFLGLVGIILVLIALKGMADFYGDKGTFNNALHAFIVGIIGVAAFIGTLVAAFIALLANLPNWAQTYVKARDWQGLANAFPQHAADLGLARTLLGIVIVAWAMLFIFVVVAMFFFRRSLRQLSTKTNVGLFATTGSLMLVGAILTIILIGLLLIWIGWIVLAVAFFSVRTTAAAQPASTST
jgi:uncharacterized membrane protein